MSLNWARLVHEKLALIAIFAYSQEPLAQMRLAKFKGEWPSHDKFLHEIPQIEATKALMELALYFRTLDDAQGLTPYWKIVGDTVGTLYLKDGKTEPLSPREMSNKIIHAEHIDWDFSESPKIVCTGKDEKWTSAEIDLIALIEIGGRLGS